MSSPNIETYLKASITLKALDNSGTLALTFTNRKTATSYTDTATPDLPLLKSVSGMGFAVSQRGMPVVNSVTVTIYDFDESIGEERRVMDLLERYTPIEQTMTISAAHATLDGTPTFSTVWSGICRRVSRSYRDGFDELTFSCDPLTLPVRRLNKTITAEEFTTAIDASVGRTLPVLIGDRTDAQGLLIGYSAASVAQFGYATNWGTTFQAGDVPSGLEGNLFYARKPDGRYVQVLSSGPMTAVTCNTNTDSGTVPSTVGLDGNTEWIVDFFYTSASDESVVTGGKIWLQKIGASNTVTTTGNLIFTLYGKDRETVLARVTVPKTRYQSVIQQNTSGDGFWLHFYFEKPVIKELSETLYLGFRVENYAAATYDYAPAEVTTAKPYWRRISTGTKYYDSGSDYSPAVRLFTCKITPRKGTTLDSEKRCYSYLDVEQAPLNSWVSGETLPDLTALDLIVPAIGTKDDAYGSITGSAGNIIRYPHEVTKLLTSSWNGTSWIVDATNWDWSKYASQYSSIFGTAATTRQVNGMADGDPTVEDVVSEVTYEHCNTLVHLSSGKLALWPWGAEGWTATKVFTDENCTITNFERMDTASVVNSIKLSYDRQIYNTYSGDRVAGGNEPGYGATYTVNSSTGGAEGAWATTSAAIYGNKEPFKQRYDWVGLGTGSDTTIQRIGKYLLTTYDHPHQVISLTAPFWDSYTVELMDMVEVLSAALPAYLGTTTDARLPTYSGTENDILDGHYWTRAQRYRCQVVGKSYDFSDTTAPVCNFSVRLISPYHPNDKR